MSTRRLEMNAEQLKTKSASQLAELGKKGDAINRLKIEIGAQKVEIVALRMQVQTLKERLNQAGEEVRTGLVRLPAVPSCAAPDDDRLNQTESRFAERLNRSFATQSGGGKADMRRTSHFRSD
jgi:seryl-tRNA synthetase